MARISFDVESNAYDEIELGDKVYKVYYDDAKLQEYSEKAKKYHKESQKFNELDVSNLTEKEEKEYTENANKIAKELVETFFGEGTFEEIYEACGKSAINLANVVKQLLEWMQAKIKVVNNDAVEKYKTKRKK